MKLASWLPCVPLFILQQVSNREGQDDLRAEHSRQEKNTGKLGSIERWHGKAVDLPRKRLERGIQPRVPQTHSLDDEGLCPTGVNGVYQE